jgi:predicted nucleotidyltransferase
VNSYGIVVITHIKAYNKVYTKCKKEGVAMCKLVDCPTNYGEICKVADIKVNYIINIVNTAAICSGIERIVLFGSALEERCKNISDIDIAIFGDETEYKFLRSKQFKEFEKQVYTYGEFQDYDVLYFQNGKKINGSIMNDINEGKVIYRKKVEAC